MPVMIAIIGECDAEFAPHAATDAAIRHSSAALGIDVESHWISTTQISERLVQVHHGVLIAPGSPYKDLGRTLQAIRCARENGIPCLGMCGGFQHMIIEYARNVLGFSDAQHAEYDPYASNLFVTKLDCSLVGRNLELQFTPDSLVAACYGAANAVESYYCNFGIAPGKVAALRSGPLRVVGRDNEGEVRVIELPEHPFFVGTLFVPQLRSTPHDPHPLINGFIRTAARQSR